MGTQVQVKTQLHRQLLNTGHRKHQGAVHQLLATSGKQRGAPPQPAV